MDTFRTWLSVHKHSILMMLAALLLVTASYALGYLTAGKTVPTPIIVETHAS